MRTHLLESCLGATVALVLLGGCDEVATTPADGGADAGAGSVTVDPPAPPSLPCPTGWSARTVHDELDAEVCEPWALGADPRCPPGQGRFPSESGCAPLGASCPSGPWPDDLPASGVIHVDDDAAPGGDGASPATALQTIGAALAVAATGDVVAVAKGAYVEAIRVPAGVTLRGACAAEVTVRSPSPSTTATVELQGADATLEDVTVTGADRPGVAARSGARGVLRGVEVRGAEGIGVWVTGASLTATRVVVRAVEPIADGRFGQGIVVEAGATLTATDLAALDDTEDGLFVADSGSSADVTNLVALGTSARPADSLGGMGVRIILGGSAIIRRAVVEDNVQANVLVRDPGSSLELEDAVVRDANPAPFVGEAQLGRGVAVQDGGSVTLRRVFLERSYDAAVRASDGSILEAEDLVVADVEPELFDGSDGFGVAVQSGATARLTRAAIVRAHTAGVDVGDDGTTLEATDLTVWSTRARPTDGRAGRGIQAAFGADVTLTRAHVGDCREIGVAMTDGVSAILSDLRVADTVGRGLEVNRGSVVDLTDVALVASQQVGLMASGAGTQVTVSGLSIVGGEATIDDLGRAMQAQHEAVIEGGRVELVDNWELGMLAVGDARVDLEDVEIRGTRRRACVETTCPERGIGYGAVAFLGGRITLRDFALSDNALLGVLLGEGGSGLFTGGVIARHPIGVNLRDPAIDFEATFVDVTFEDNERNVEAQMLPLPDAALDER